LAALAAQTRPPDDVCGIAQQRDAETLAVLAEFQGKLPQLRTIIVEVPGVVAALNLGVEQSTGEIVVLTDDDAEADPDWLQRIEAWFLKDPQIGAVGGRDRLQYRDHPHLSDPGFASEVGRITWYGRTCGNHHCPTKAPMEVDTLKGVNLAVRRSALNPAGFGQELRGWGAQVGWEVDLCMHVKAKGFRLIFDSDVSVKHYASKRPAGLERSKPENFAGAPSRDVAFNMGFVAGKWYKPVQILGSFLYATLRGSKGMPGLLAVVKYCVLGDFGVIRRFTNQFPATVKGYLAGIRVRKQRPSA
jgi:GT2 family glycosyltransferase